MSHNDISHALAIHNEPTLRWVNTGSGWVGPFEAPPVPSKPVAERHPFWGVFKASRKQMRRGRRQR